MSTFTSCRRHAARARRVCGVRRRAARCSRSTGRWAATIRGSSSRARRASGLPRHRSVAAGIPRNAALLRPDARGSRRTCYAALLDALGLPRGGRRRRLRRRAVGAPARAPSPGSLPRARPRLGRVGAGSTHAAPLAWHVLRLAARWPALLRAMQRRAARDPERAASRSIPDPAQRARLLGDPEAWPLMQELQLSTGDRMPLRIAGTENDIATTRAKLELPLEQLAVPVLVIHGTADRMAPFAHGRAVASRAPGAELLSIDGGEHACLFTHRAENPRRGGEVPRSPPGVDRGERGSVSRRPEVRGSAEEGRPGVGPGHGPRS